MFHMHVLIALARRCVIEPFGQMNVNEASGCFSEAQTSFLQFMLM